MKHSTMQSCLFRLATFAVFATPACSAADPSVDSNVSREEDQAIARVGQALTYGGPNLMWQNTQTGELNAWVLDPSDRTKVVATQSLDWRCGSGDGCSQTWRPVDTASASILWHNAWGGQLQAWRFDENGTVAADPELGWTCGLADGCSTTWKPVGRVNSRGPCSGFFCDSRTGLLWHNPTSGELSVWNLSGSAVTGTSALDWNCGTSDGCSAAWRPILTEDFNRDGNSDVLWHNRTTGVLSVWLLDGTHVTGTKELSWRCAQDSGCADAWSLIGAADIDADGIKDLAWHNRATGELSTWLLDNDGRVKRAAALSWTCDSACSRTWKPIGFVTFPPRPPR